MRQKIAFYNCLILGLLLLVLAPKPMGLLGLVFLLGAYGKAKLGMINPPTSKAKMRSQIIHKP